MNTLEPSIIAAVDESISKKARQVAKYAAVGYSPKEIAYMLGRNQRTVKRDVERITAIARKLYKDDRLQFQKHLVPRFYSLYYARGEISETEFNS